jgi:hypothetical protein
MFLFYFDDAKLHQPTKPLGTHIKACGGHFKEWVFIIIKDLICALRELSF